MRLWSIHPKYLDTVGLVALWREALLAQKVLCNKSKGYKRHPQLIRFRNHPQPEKAIGNYLLHIWREAEKRKYNFKEEKILTKGEIEKIRITTGQLRYEFQFLCSKLKTRNIHKYKELVSNDQNTIECHPAFWVANGDIEAWEKLILKSD